MGIISPKTDSGRRSILLPPSTAERLRSRGLFGVSEWIFPQKNDLSLPVNPGAAYRKLKKLIEEYHLPDLRFHDLRHTFSTHAVSAGVDEKTLASLLGHTDAGFTLDVYTHITDDMQTKAADVIGKKAV